MKKYLVLSAVLLGAVATSRAGGIDFHIGFPLPPLPHIVIGHPAPRVVVHAPPVCEPPVFYAPAPYCPPPRVVYTPPCPPPVVYARPYPVQARERWAQVDRREREHHHRSYDRRDRW